MKSSIIVMRTEYAMALLLDKDEEKAKKICIAMVKKFTDDEAFLEKELKFFFPVVQCFELTPEHMTGKRVKEE